MFVGLCREEFKCASSTTTSVSPITQCICTNSLIPKLFPFLTWTYAISWVANWEWGYWWPGNEATGDMGMRLLVGWEWGHWWLGNEATGDMGMRLLVGWEWGHWWLGNETTGDMGMRPLVVSAWEWDRGPMRIGLTPHPPQTDKINTSDGHSPSPLV